MAEAGWYPDPYGMADERWWDGALWTVAERAVEAAPPAAVVEPARRGALGRLRNLASAHADKKAKSAAAVLETPPLYETHAAAVVPAQPEASVRQVPLDATEHAVTSPSFVAAEPSASTGAATVPAEPPAAKQEPANVGAGAQDASAWEFYTLPTSAPAASSAA